MNSFSNKVSWTLQILVFAIIGHTLFFKFSGAADSVALFTQLGLEPIGRIGIGITELVAVTLILIPRTVVAGAVLSGGLMAGALFAHATRLGFADGMGALAAMAALAGLASAGILLLRRHQIWFIGSAFTEQRQVSVQ